MVVDDFDCDADEEDCVIVDTSESAQPTKSQVHKERAARSKKAFRLRRPRGRLLMKLY